MSNSCTADRLISIDGVIALLGRVKIRMQVEDNGLIRFEIVGAGEPSSQAYQHVHAHLVSGVRKMLEGKAQALVDGSVKHLKRLARIMAKDLKKASR